MKKKKKKNKQTFFKVCRIKISQNCKVSNYTLGILGKPSMHRGAHIGFVTLSFAILKKTFRTILTNFSCKNWLHLQQFFF